LTDFVQGFKSIQATKVGIVTQAIIGLVLVFFFIIDFLSGYTLIPNNFMPWLLGYFAWIVALLLIKSITDLIRAAVKGSKCHYLLAIL